jgi:hypothetical protein
LELLLKAPEGKRKIEKMSKGKSYLQSRNVVVETLKAYKLLCCFVVGKAKMQLNKIVQEMHCKDPWIGMNSQSHKGLCMQS